MKGALRREEKIFHRSTTKYYKFGQVCEKENKVTAFKIEWKMSDLMASWRNGQNLVQLKCLPWALKCIQ